MANENALPDARSSNESLQYRLASERNRLRWEYQEKHEKAAIETFINEDAATKQRKSIRMALKMSEIVLNIQDALHSDAEHDLPKATENFKKLLEEPFTTISLLYAPCVVKTVYLCSRYFKNGETRALAEKCYKRFRPCFGVPYGETFETTFQAAVRNFWEKENTIVYDPTKYDYRQFTMNDDISVEIGDNTVNSRVDGIDLNLDDESLVLKDEICEVEIDNSQIHKINSEEIEINIDTKDVAMEIKTECETEIDKSDYDCNITIKEEIMDTNEVVIPDYDCNITIREEIMDTNEVEIPDCTIKPESVSDMLQITVKPEPVEFENFCEEYKLDKYDISNCNVKLESTSDMKDGSVLLEEIREARVLLEPVDFKKLNIKYDSEKDCYIQNSH